MHKLFCGTTFIDAFLKEASTFTGKILIIHGDAHAYILDKPFADANNITRLEVYGSPVTSAVTISVDVAQPEIFSFAHIKPQKKP